jgi:hypothetical protein
MLWDNATPARPNDPDAKNLRRFISFSFLFVMRNKQGKGESCVMIALVLETEAEL